MRGYLLLGFALFIDGLQFAVDAGTFVIGNLAGTIAGGAAGCAAGQYVAGSVGCTLGGIVGSFFGSFANAPLASIGIPLGIMLGMVLSFCISAIFGSMLLLLLAQSGMFYTRYIIGGGLVETVPGINSLPSWTLMTWLCITAKKAEKGSLVASLAVAGTSTTGLEKGLLTTAARPQTNSATQRSAGTTPAFQNTANDNEEGGLSPKTTRSPQIKPLSFDGVRPSAPVGASANDSRESARQPIAYAA